MEPTWMSDCGRVVLYHGDCLNVLPTLKEGSVDAVVTDPPYGIGENYATFDDTKESISTIACDVFPHFPRIAKVVMLTPGNGNAHMYPEPDWTMCWINKAGSGMNKWGFTCWQPVLVYGKDPFLARGLGGRPDLYDGMNEPSKANGHPCPKPLGVMRWMVDRATAVEHALVLDPFMGSGTTGVACIQTGRRFIGIELDATYFDIAKRRIIAELAQPRLIQPEAVAHTQMDLI